MDGKRVLCIFVVWGIFLTALSTADNASWEISQVQSHVSGSGSWVDIEKAPGTNQFGIVNYVKENGSLNLYYNQGNPSSWTTTLVDSLTSIGSDKRFGFAYNPVTGRPAVSYQNGKTLYLASFNGVSWDRQTIASDADYGSSLTFDQTGNAIIAFSSHDSYSSIRCAYQKDGVWQTKTLQSNISSVKDPIVKLNPSTGEASIAFSRTFAGVYYARSSDMTNWTVERVGFQEGASRSMMLDFDPITGNPAVAFEENLSSPLDVCRNNGSTWETPVTAVASLNRSFGFSFTPEGEAAIAYVGRLTDNSNGVQILLENDNGSFSVFDQYLFGSTLQFDGPADLLWDDSGAYIAYKSWNEGIYFAHVVPEPATILLLTLGSLALRRRTK